MLSEGLNVAVVFLLLILTSRWLNATSHHRRYALTAHNLKTALLTTL
jgi:hypothetical protein